MSNYKGHVRYNFTRMLPFCLCALFLWQKADFQQLGAFSASFIYATLYMNPDLDLVHQVRLFSWRGLFTLPFRFYSIIFRHRGLSHHIVLGTLSRLFWAFGVYLFFFYLLYESFDGVEAFRSVFYRNKTMSYYIIGGVFFADVGHILLDGIDKKKLFRL